MPYAGALPASVVAAIKKGVDADIDLRFGQALRWPDGEERAQPANPRVA